MNFLINDDTFHKIPELVLSLQPVSIHTTMLLLNHVSPNVSANHRACIIYRRIALEEYQTLVYGSLRCLLTTLSSDRPDIQCWV